MYSTTGRTRASRCRWATNCGPRDRLVGLFLAAVSLTATLPPASADAKRGDNRPNLLILRVESTAVTDAQRQSLTAALAARAKEYKHYRIRTSKTDLVEEMFEFECTEAGVECLSSIGGKYKASKVVYSEVVKDDTGKLQWSLRLVQMKGPNEPIARVAQSTVQTVGDIGRPRKAVENGLLVLIGPVDMKVERAEAPGTLHVQLVGGGVALVYVNEKLAGRSSVGGLKVKLAPGTYAIKVVRAGFKDWASKAEVKSGATATLTVELVAAPAQPVGGGSGASGVKAVPVTSTWWFWTAVGVGVATAAVVVWAVTREDETIKLGNAAFSLDSSDAHLDPVFFGK